MMIHKYIGYRYTCQHRLEFTDRCDVSDIIYGQRTLPSNLPQYSDLTVFSD